MVSSGFFLFDTMYQTVLPKHCFFLIDTTKVYIYSCGIKWVRIVKNMRYKSKGVGVFKF